MTVKSRKSQPDLLTRLAGKKPQSDTYTVVLDPEPLAELDRARQALDRAELFRKPDQSNPAYDDALAAHEAAEAAAVDATVTLHLHGLPRDVYEALQLLHPPTEVQKKRDETYNVDTLMPAAIAATVVEDPDKPVVVTVADLDSFHAGGVLPGRAFTTAQVTELIRPWNHGETVLLWNTAVAVCTKARNPSLPFGSRRTGG